MADYHIKCCLLGTSTGTARHSSAARAAMRTKTLTAIFYVIFQLLILVMRLGK